jgi:hypothetical protein
MFLDFETQNEGTHIPVFCHIRWRENEIDQNIPENEFSSTPIMRWVWKERSFGPNTNVRNEVGDFIFSTKFSGYTIIAHNMRGFDGCFLLRYLVEHGIRPKIIPKGKQILSINVPNSNIRVIDSLNFLPMRLSAFQKTFNLPDNEKKGYFPILFINEKNFGYIGEMPPEKLYNTQQMNEKEYKEFKAWYDDHQNSDYIFNFDLEIEKYCKQDVNLLALGCWSYRKLILSLTANKCDPFQYLTLAQLCSAIYKADHMPENSIAAVPAMGYADSQHYSSKSLEWLNYLEKVKKIDIKHIGNSSTGEPYVLGDIRVDGLDINQKTVYEFYGCFYHGCEKCFPKRYTLHPLFRITFEEVLKKTYDREIRLRVLGYKVVSMWECKWNSMKKSYPKINAFVEMNKDGFTPLNPYDFLWRTRRSI